MAIYQEKKEKQTKDGRSWYYKCYYTDVFGNRKQKVSKLFKTKSEAKDAEIIFLNEIATHDETNDRNVDFITIYNEWLREREKELKETTNSDFQYRSDKHIKPFFENYKLHSIKINTINKWYDNLDNKPLSLEYKNTIVGYCKAFFEYCRDNHNFDNKVVAKIKKYRNDTPVEKIQESEWNFWTFDEWKKFINIVDDYDYKMMFTFLYYTGLRYGEFDALTWKDFNIKDKTIRITKTLSNKVKNKKFVIQSPKTKNSVRFVDLDDNLVKQLIEYKDYKNNKCYNFDESNYIFGDVKYVPATTFRTHLNQYINIAGIKKITPHGFRHSHVSLLIYLGCDSRDVAERIGDTVQMVEKTYYHMFPKKKKSTIEKLNILEK